MRQELIVIDNDIKNKIYKIRGVQVMLDRDLANLYSIETRVLNQAVKRNIERFPDNFMFSLSLDEINILVSQNVIPSKKHLGGYKPYAFTEQGVAMLSGVLNTKIAINISIRIINAFVSMRHFISRNVDIFTRLDKVERKQLDQDKKISKIFTAIEQKEIKPRQGIFYDGQVFDAYKFVSGLIRSADKSIILIDNYIDECTLSMFAKSKNNVRIIIYTDNFTDQLRRDLDKYNKQYQFKTIEIRPFKRSHDRFLIIDKTVIYHFGASLKDLGKKWFAFSKLSRESVGIISKLE